MMITILKSTSTCFGEVCDHEHFYTCQHHSDVTPFSQLSFTLPFLATHLILKITPSVPAMLSLAGQQQKKKRGVYTLIKGLCPR